MFGKWATFQFLTVTPREIEELYSYNVSRIDTLNYIVNHKVNKVN